MVGDAVEKMQEADQIASGLSQAVGEISDVLQLISAIAGKTNLLALNATIEAARAAWQTESEFPNIRSTARPPHPTLSHGGL